MESIQENLIKFIKSSGKSQKQIAEETGISTGLICEYASGKKIPSLYTFKRLCKVLDCSYEDILD